MELSLNLAWTVLTTLMCWLWIRYRVRRRAGLALQLVALALVVLILFPVISVTDDLVMAQNPAETDSCQRKDHVCATVHSALHPVLGMVPPLFTEICSGAFCIAVEASARTATVQVPALDSIQIRPPPTV